MEGTDFFDALLVKDWLFCDAPNNSAILRQMFQLLWERIFVESHARKLIELAQLSI